MGRYRICMVKSVVKKEKSAMKDRLKVLHVALERGNYELAAHALVYGMVKASIKMKDISGNGGNPPCSAQIAAARCASQ